VDGDAVKARTSLLNVSLGYDAGLLLFALGVSGGENALSDL
jgi:hypothetical protein